MAYDLIKNIYGKDHPRLANNIRYLGNIYFDK